MTPPITLLVFAVLTGTLGPRLLARSSWLDRSPRLGVVAWQALSFSVLAAVVLAGAAVALPVVPFTANIAELLHACADALHVHHHATPGGVERATGAAVAVAMLTRATCCLTAGYRSAARERRRHADALTLVARRHQGWDALVVDRATAAAYCLPGRHQNVVLTTGALAALGDAELAAVVAHERAHLRGRHDLVLVTAAALRRAFPGIPVFRDAHRELTRLVEMLADDIAARCSDRPTVATALVRLAEASTPVATLGAGGTTSLARVRRLMTPANPLGAPASVLAVVASAALLTTPVAVVSAPAFAGLFGHLCPIDFLTQALA